MVVADASRLVELISIDDGFPSVDDCCSAGADDVLAAITVGVDDEISAAFETASEVICVRRDVITSCAVAFGTDKADPTDVSLADVSMKFVVACAFIMMILVDVIASGAPVLTSSVV